MSKEPNLESPILIAGFDGWPNAGNVSTDTVDMLTNLLEADKFAEMAPDPFYRYSDIRPCIKVEGGQVTEFSFAPYEFFCQHREGGRDVILFLGNEPEFSARLPITA